MVQPKNSQPGSKFFREMEKRMAVSDVEKARKATLKKTQALRESRLAKETEDQAADAERRTKT